MKKALLILITTILIIACQSSKKERVEVVTQNIGTNTSKVETSEIESIKFIETEDLKVEKIVNKKIDIADTQSETEETEETETKEVVIEVKETSNEVSPSETSENLVKAVLEEISKPQIIPNFDHSAWSTFLNKYVTKNGNVNYKLIKSNQEDLNAYLNLFANTSPDNTWSKNEKLAYWINAYNAFTIKLIIDNYPTKSIKDISKPWDKKLANINGKKVSLNYIEHDVLRKMEEPRIHFAINCASVSCPKLLNTAFLPETLNSQLNTVAKLFINSKENRIEKGNVKLSKIFKWFSNDFKANGNVLDFINKYSDTKVSNKESYKYLDYNWSLNE